MAPEWSQNQWGNWSQSQRPRGDWGGGNGKDGSNENNGSDDSDVSNGDKDSNSDDGNDVSNSDGCNDGDNSDAREVAGSG